MPISARNTSSSISASTTTARAAYPPSTAKYVEVLNPTTAIAFVNSGDVTVTATTTGSFVNPSSSKILERDANDTNLAVILSTGTGTIYFQPVSKQE